MLLLLPLWWLLVWPWGEGGVLYVRGGADGHGAARRGTAMVVTALPKLLRVVMMAFLIVALAGINFANLAAAAIENARLSEMDRASAVLEERGRIARDLHDAVSQTLFSASLIAEGLRDSRKLSADRERQGLEDLRRLTRGALAEMRALLYELHPGGLAEKPLGSLLATKRLLRLEDAEAVRRRLAEEGEVFSRMLGEPAAREAFSAFMDKRRPDFSRC